MKKISFILFLTTSLMFCQERSGLYVITGLSKPNLKTNLLTSNSNLNYSIGVGAILEISKTFSHQLEFVYSKNQIELLNNQNQYDKFNFSMLQLGYYSTYNILKVEEDKFYIGPQLGALVNFGTPTLVNKAYFGEINYLPSQVEGEKLNKSSNFFNPSFSIGINSGYNKFKLNLRYYLGINNIFKDIDTNNAITPNGKINSINLILTYKLSRF